MSGSSKFTPTPEMVADEVDLRPVSVWLWAVRKHYGSLTQRPREFIRLNLLPSAQASVRPEGIYFERMYYICSPEWRARARESGSWHITIAYDPRLVDFIFIREGGKCRDTCRLTDRYWKLLKGLDFREAHEYFDRQKASEQLNQSRKNQSQVSRRTQQDKLFKEAQQQTQGDINNQERSSNTALLKGVKEKRETERAHDRRSGAKEWYGEVNQDPDLQEHDASDQLDRVTNEHYIAPSQDDDLLDGLLEEFLKNES